MDQTKTPQFQQFSGKTVLGVDYGTKRIGLAIFTPNRDPFPTPLAQIGNDSGLYKTIGNFCSEECVEHLVVGLPYLTDGKATEMTEQARKFGEELAQKLELPLSFQDETLSSFTAEERMKNSPRYNFKIDKSQLDAVAATIILEDFFGVSY